MKTYKISNKELRNLILEVESKITFGAVPKTIQYVQNDFIRNISNNDFFTDGEKYALNLFFETNTTLHSEKIQLFESQIDEGIADWFKKGVAKVKEVFGGIRDYIVKVWDKIKETFKTMMVKAWDWMKGLALKAKDKIKAKVEEFLKGPKKPELEKEIKNVTEMSNWLATFYKTVKDNVSGAVKFLGDKLVKGTSEKVEAEANKIQENIFTKDLTEGLINSSSLLLEEEDEKATFTTKEGWKKNWKEYVWNIIKIILNPVMGTFGVVGGWMLNKSLNLGSILIAKLGGPGPYKFHILPEIVMAGTELSGLFNSTWNWFEKFISEKAKLIPGLSTIIHFWEFGHKVLFTYSIIEVIKIAYSEIKGNINQASSAGAVKGAVKESYSPDLLRMRKLAGLK